MENGFMMNDYGNLMNEEEFKEYSENLEREIKAVRSQTAIVEREIEVMMLMEENHDAEATTTEEKDQNNSSSSEEDESDEMMDDPVVFLKFSDDESDDEMSEDFGEGLWRPNESEEEDEEGVIDSEAARMEARIAFDKMVDQMAQEDEQRRIAFGRRLLAPKKFWSGAVRSNEWKKFFQ
jgi:hypothetical protein